MYILILILFWLGVYASLSGDVIWAIILLAWAAYLFWMDPSKMDRRRIERKKRPLLMPNRRLDVHNTIIYGIPMYKDEDPRGR